MKSNRTKATSISSKVRKQVLERDHHRCVICGDTWMLETAHIFVSRAHGGKGVTKNLAMLCHKHHKMLDSGRKEEQDNIRLVVESYLKVKYGRIDLSELKYDKWKGLICIE
jgi:predicted restriction endonuclease